MENIIGFYIFVDVLNRLMGQRNSDGPPHYINIPGHPDNTYGEMLAATFPNTRPIVMYNGLGILTNAEEEQINFVVSSTRLQGKKPSESEKRNKYLCCLINSILYKNH